MENCLRGKYSWNGLIGLDLLRERDGSKNRVKIGFMSLFWFLGRMREKVLFVLRLKLIM